MSRLARSQVIPSAPRKASPVGKSDSSGASKICVLSRPQALSICGGE